MTAFSSSQLVTWTGGRWTAPPVQPLTGFTMDSRQLRPGQVFVALRTAKRDGHDFLPQAAAAGAGAALVASANPALALPQLVVTDPLAAFQTIAREHRSEFHGTVVGVTGSVGKTSTKDLLTVLLGGAPGVLATEGNLNNHIGVPLTLTRLDPAVHRAAVIEAGINAPGEMATLAAMIEPDHAVVTLVAPAHLEKLGAIENVAAEKATLPAFTRRGGLQVFPVSCWAFEEFQLLANPLILVPEQEDEVCVTGRTVKFGVVQRPERTELKLDGRRTFNLRRVSGGMAQNTALALALASELGVDDATLQARLEQWTPSKWRGELRQSGAATVYCDFYNANPASMSDAIDAFNEMVGEDRPRLYVLGCMEELGAEAAMFHHALGRALRLRPQDRAFVIGDHAAAVCAGATEAGRPAGQVQAVNAIEPVRVVLANFTGSVFLKGSRRYQLETLLEPAQPVTAHA